MTRRRTGEAIGTLIIASLLFLPIRGCLDDSSSRSHHGRSGYGRRNDLRQIGMAIELYSDEHGTMPATLWNLKDFIDSPRVLASPGDLEAQDSRGEWTLDRYHYLYEGGGNLGDIPADSPLVVYPYRSGEDVMFSVLFKYGSVELLREEAFLNRLTQDRDGRARP